MKYACLFIMKVQIFIPTFNRMAKLDRAIRSALNQTYPMIEVVILDNHSLDDTPKLVASIMATDSRVRYVRHERNLGMFGNFNSIPKLVTAEFFSVLTDDDEYEPCFVETAINCFESHKSIQFVACNAPTRLHGKIVKSQLDCWKEGLYKSNAAVLNCLSGQYPIFTNCLFSANIKDDFCFNEEIGNECDGLMLTFLFSKYDAFVTKTVTGYWNNDGTNASSVHKYDAISHVNATINSGRLYKDFCKKNNIAVRGRLGIERRKIIAILVAADRSSFGNIIENSVVNLYYGNVAIAALGLLHKVKFLQFCLRTKSLLRSVVTPIACLKN